MGANLALAFANEGASSIFLTDVAQDEGERRLAELGKTVESASSRSSSKVRCKYGVLRTPYDEDSIRTTVEQCVEAFGGIDHVVNIACETAERKNVLETSLTEFDAYVTKTMVQVWLSFRRFRLPWYPVTFPTFLSAIVVV